MSFSASQENIGIHNGTYASAFIILQLPNFETSWILHLGGTKFGPMNHALLWKIEVNVSSIIFVLQ